jgi:hypothetical protein
MVSMGLIISALGSVSIFFLIIDISFFQANSAANTLCFQSVISYFQFFSIANSGGISVFNLE